MTQRERVFEMLSERPCETGDFLRAHIPRFSARIEELRRQGHEITCEYLRSGAYRYELTTAGDNAVLCWVADLTKPRGERISQEWRTLTPDGMAV